jgi:hypothetical protein
VRRAVASRVNHAADPRATHCVANSAMVVSQILRRFGMACAVFAAAVLPARAQNPAVAFLETSALNLDSVQPAGPAPTPRHTGVKALIKDLVDDVVHLPSVENALWAGVGGAAALAVHPADESVNHAMVNSNFAHDFFKPGAVIGALPTLLATSITVYAVGRGRDQPKVSHTGMDLIQALMVSEGLVQGLKFATQRERPDGTPRSLPSGHASDTFAVATALERHLGWKGAVPACIFASYVAISRLPANRHWLSDVVFGSSVGVIAGRTVTRHGREFPVTIVPTQGGVALVYVRDGR